MIDRLVPTEYADIMTAILAADPDDNIILEAIGSPFTGANNKNIDPGGVNYTFKGETNVAADHVIDLQNVDRAFYLHGGETLDFLFQDLTIENGRVVTGAPFTPHGGAICTYMAGFKAVNCRFIGNYAEREGGAIWGYGGSYVGDFRFEDCHFEDNIGLYSTGAVNIMGGDFTALRCTFKNNSSGRHAGAMMIANTWQFSIHRCFFESNTATVLGYYAGAIALSSGNVAGSVTNSVFIGNQSAYRGSAIHHYSPWGASMVFKNNTYVQNVCTAPGHYGALYCSTASCDPILTNEIFWGNTPGDQICLYSGAHPTLSHSDVQGGCAGCIDGGGNIDADPLFKADGYHLTEPSPCRDVGDPTVVDWDWDIDGEARKTAGGDVDMGADQWESSFSRRGRFGVHSCWATGIGIAG